MAFGLSLPLTLFCTHPVRAPVGDVWVGVGAPKISGGRWGINNFSFYVLLQSQSSVSSRNKIKWSLSKSRRGGDPDGIFRENDSLESLPPHIEKVAD